MGPSDGDGLYRDEPARDAEPEPAELWIGQGSVGPGWVPPRSGSGAGGNSGGGAPTGRGGGTGRARWIALVAGFAVLVAVIAVQHFAGGGSGTSAAPTSRVPATAVRTWPATAPSSPFSAPSSARPSSLAGSSYPTAPTSIANSETPGGGTYVTTAAPGPTIRTSQPGSPSTTSVPESALPGAGNWQVVGYGGDGKIVRYRPATGTVTVTPVPTLDSSGPYSFVLTPVAAILRPLDNVLGYRVPISGRASELAGRLADGGPLLPGPRPGQLWVSGGDGGAARLLLVDTGGHALGPKISVSSIDPNDWPAPDGAGYALVTGVGGAYDARPTGLRLITHGTVLAAGPTGFLVYECTATAHCGVAVVHRSTYAHTPLDGVVLPDPQIARTGVISPNGAFAAFNVVSDDGQISRSELHLLDLRSGLDRVVSDALDAAQSAGFTPAFAFAPDGKWLIFVTHSGGLAALNTATGRVATLPASLPSVTAVAVQDGG